MKARPPVIERRAPEPFEFTLSTLFLSSNGPATITGPFVQPAPRRKPLRPHRSFISSKSRNEKTTPPGAAASYLQREN
jgi:hypothetical protein